MSTLKSDESIERTPQEKQSYALRLRFIFHIRDYYADFKDIEEYPNDSFDFEYYQSIDKLEVWRVDIYNKDKSKNKKFRTIGLFWDGDEVISYDEVEDALIEMISTERQARAKRTFNMWTSAQTVSAILAVASLIAIIVMQFVQQKVPEQLWTTFTAVVSFYFGRGTREK